MCTTIICKLVLLFTVSLSIDLNHNFCSRKLYKFDEKCLKLGFTPSGGNCDFRVSNTVSSDISKYRCEHKAKKLTKKCGRLCSSDIPYDEIAQRSLDKKLAYSIPDAFIRIKESQEAAIDFTLDSLEFAMIPPDDNPVSKFLGTGSKIHMSCTGGETLLYITSHDTIDIRTLENEDVRCYSDSLDNSKTEKSKADELYKVTICKQGNILEFRNHETVLRKYSLNKVGNEECEKRFSSNLCTVKFEDDDALMYRFVNKS